jgi:hypothetical protein
MPRVRLVDLALRLIVLGLASGCAVGQKIPYTQPTPLLTLVGSGTERIGLAVHDQRRQVVKDPDNADFVGEMRSLYHIPYGVHTQSGKPLAVDLTNLLAAAFTAKGFIPVAVTTASNQKSEDVMRALARQGVPRSVLLTLFEWRTDTYFKTQLFYDLDLQVLNETGRVVAEDRRTGHVEELVMHPAVALSNYITVLTESQAIKDAVIGNVPSTATVPPPRSTSASGGAATPAATSWRVFSYAPGMTDRTGLAELAPSNESCRLIRNALEPHHPGRILACEAVVP